MVNRAEILQRQYETLDWREIYREAEQKQMERELTEQRRRIEKRIGLKLWKGDA